MPCEFFFYQYNQRIYQNELPASPILKGLAQAKISKKSVILFWLLIMTISCKHVHRLELQKFFILSATHSPVRRYRYEIPVFLILAMVVNN